jgi:glycosyltransferase involved in cell wall biosynthesis
MIIKSVGFSVLMSVYQKESPIFFRQCLKSLFDQSLLPTEIVLVKDGPLPSELDNIIEEFNSRFPHIFKIISLPKNKGLGNALSIGIVECSNEIIARMDSDDICFPDRFQKQLNYILENPNISVLGCAIKEFNRIPNDLNTYRRLPRKLPEIVSFAKFRNPLNHPTVVFKKADVLAVGSYLDMPLFEDYFLWIRMLRKGFIIENLDSALLHFRMGNDMIGRRHGLFYVKCELNFIRSIKSIGFIDRKQYLISLICKLPLRVLPKVFLKVFYKLILR